MTRAERPGTGRPAGDPVGGGPVSVVFLPVDPAGPLQVADVRGLAFSISLLRLLALAGTASTWYRVVGDERVPEVPRGLTPSPACAEQGPGAESARTVLVYSASVYRPDAARLAAGVAVEAHCGRGLSNHFPEHSGSAPRRTCRTISHRTRDVLTHCPVQPIRWLHEQFAAACHSMPLAELFDVLGESNLAWWCVSRSASQPLSLDPARIRTACLANPLYRVQQAHQRIGSELRRVTRHQWPLEGASGSTRGNGPGAQAAQRLSALVDVWPRMIERAAVAHEPHRVILYLRDLANALHKYQAVNAVRIDEPAALQAHVSVLLATRRLLATGLTLFGNGTPEVL